MKTERYYVSENVTLTVEVSTGRLDIIVRHYYGETVKSNFWYATRDTKTKKWTLNFCINGFCYDSAKIAERFASRADVIKYLSEKSLKLYNRGLEEIPVEEVVINTTNETGKSSGTEDNTTIYEVLVDNTVSDTRFIVKRYNGNTNRTYIYNQVNLPKTVLQFMLSKDVEIKKGRDTTLYRKLDKTVYTPHEKLYIKQNEAITSWIERNLLSGAIAEEQIVAIYDNNNNVEYIGKACYTPINLYHVIERFEFVEHELRINERL